jgi:hypothetical protein
MKGTIRYALGASMTIALAAAPSIALAQDVPEPPATPAPESPALSSPDSPPDASSPYEAPEVRKPAPVQEIPEERTVTITRIEPPYHVSAAPRVRERVIPESRTYYVEQQRPQTGLIAAGVLTLGLSYGPSLVVATTSKEPADKYLTVPVAGPWIDLAKRPGCQGRDTECSRERSNQVLLVANGIFQAIGALELIVGLTVPETTLVAVKGTTLKVRPSAGMNGAGITAYGTF